MTADFPSADFSIALVGNPNCGKTTIFNALTGNRQKVGNWAGVTVERKSGYFTMPHAQHAGGADEVLSVEVVDLPGLYSLGVPLQGSAIDEHIAQNFIVKQQADLIVNIVDATHLERHLYLTMQLLEMGTPLILAINMADVAKAQGISIDAQVLSQKLGCQVVMLTAHQPQGILDLKQAIIKEKTTRIQQALSETTVLGEQEHDEQASKLFVHVYPEVLQNALHALAQTINQLEFQDFFAGNKPKRNQWLAVRLLEEDGEITSVAPSVLLQQAAYWQAEIRQALQEDADILLADARYRVIDHLVKQAVVVDAVSSSTWTSSIDKIVLNRVLGLPIFFGMMYLLFFFAINVGGVFQDFFDLTSQTIFVDGLAHWLAVYHAPSWLIILLANGIGKGINTTVTFIPVIGAMFLFLAWLEDSGYMMRAAFVVDRLMRGLGLPGKAFIPMIVGFGCNVPAVMAARTLENKRDRILTIMMSPFMSCSARLAIYAVFTSAFFPYGSHNIVFALYLIGIGMAVLTGFILRGTLLKGEPAPLIMELPGYHIPRMKSLFLHAWQRLKNFVFRAGKLIVPICVLIGLLNTFNIDGTMNNGNGDIHSLLSVLGQWLTPIFAPMGIEQDNWPATVGLAMGVLAKEVVIGTLNALYSQMGHLLSANVDFHFWASLKQAVYSIPENAAQLWHALANPMLASAPIDQLTTGVYGMMAEKFDGQVGAFAYLLFVLLYFPCVSTTAAMLRELHRGWALFSIVWMTGVAYGVAVLFYQIATWSRHPATSCYWVGGIVLSFLTVMMLMRAYASYTSRTTHMVVLATGGERG